MRYIIIPLLFFNIFLGSFAQQRVHARSYAALLNRSHRIFLRTMSPYDRRLQDDYDYKRFKCDRKRVFAGHQSLFAKADTLFVIDLIQYDHPFNIAEFVASGKGCFGFQAAFEEEPDTRVQEFHSLDSRLLLDAVLSWDKASFFKDARRAEPEVYYKVDANRLCMGVVAYRFIRQRRHAWSMEYLYEGYWWLPLSWKDLLK